MVQRFLLINRMEPGADLGPGARAGTVTGLSQSRDGPRLAAPPLAVMIFDRLAIF